MSSFASSLYRGSVMKMYAYRMEYRGIVRARQSELKRLITITWAGGVVTERSPRSRCGRRLDRRNVVSPGSGQNQVSRRPKHLGKANGNEPADQTAFPG